MLCRQRNPGHFALDFPSSSFAKLEYLDSGTYSHVMKAIDLENDHTPVVLKVSQQSGVIVTAMLLNTPFIRIRQIIKVLQRQTMHRLSELSFKGCELYQDVYQEIVILYLLSNLHETVVDTAGYEYQSHSFPRIFRTRIVHGPIPNYFIIRRFDETFRKVKVMEHFEDSFGPPREHLVTVMKFGGDSLWDRIQANAKPEPMTVDQLISVCFQVTFALAVAEGVYQFEHRDLHVCNVLVKATKKKLAIFKYRSAEYTVLTYGIKACIIDATFSRMAIAGQTFFVDLSSRLKGAASNANPDGQEVAYKKMYQLVGDQWKQWYPQSNIIWLKYFFEEILASDAFASHATADKTAILKALIELVAKYKTVAEFMSKVSQPPNSSDHGSGSGSSSSGAAPGSSSGNSSSSSSSSSSSTENSTVSKRMAQSMSDLK